jgi:hypothetical protein
VNAVIGLKLASPRAIHRASGTGALRNSLHGKEHCHQARRGGAGTIVS